MVEGVYKITNDRTSEVYIGQTTDLDSRKNTHFRELAQGKHINKGMQKDHNRGDTFTFEIIEQMPNATLADLKNKESQYINKFNSFREGYNRTPGGAMDQFKGRYKYGGGRLPPEKYKPTEKYLSRVLGDCPECEGNLIKKEGKFGEYAGCDNFPKCKFTCSIDQINQQSNIPTINYKPISTPKTKYTTVTYDDEPIDFKPLTIPKKPKTTSKSNKKPLKTEFEKFCTQKNNYLTKSDCGYLAEKYNIDISQVNTVKKANPIIRNYLNSTDQWETAMEDLYKNNNRPIRKKDQHAIGAFVLGYCPECNSRLIRISKFFIQCENYPSCSFSCSDNYYNKHILTLSPQDEVIPSTTGDSKTISNIETETNVKAIPNRTDYGENEFNKKEKSVVNEEIEKQGIKQPNTESDKFDKDKIDYCSNCGVKLDSEDIYCSNCGEKIDEINEESIEERSIKQYLFYCKDELSKEFRLSKIKCTSWIIAISILLLLIPIICIPNPQEYLIGNFMCCILFSFAAGIATFILSSIVVDIYEEHKH